MINLLPKTLSPLALKTYRILLSKSGKTAKALSRPLRISTNAVYRPIKELLELGLITKSATYPIIYQALPVAQAKNLYTNIFEHDFTHFFGLKEKKSNPQISFIFTRDQMMKETANETKNAKRSISMIMSGHEIPAESLLISKQAIERGVNIRLLAQNSDKKSIIRYENMMKIGIQIKYLPIVHSRIFIVDEKIVFVGSYDPSDYKKAVGVRFHYPPFAKMLLQLFDRHWFAAKEI